MIKIVLLLLLFLLYVSIEREGLRNYNPILRDNKVYGVNTNKNSPDNIYNLLITPDKKTPSGKSLYDKKYTDMAKSDIILDMQYFNNASYLIFKLSDS